MEEETINNHTVFLTLAGSQVYGTSTPESDTDYRGVCLLPEKRLYFGLGIHNFEQKNVWADGSDKTVFDFRKACKLMAENSPGMLELLYTPEKFWKTVRRPWWNLLYDRDKFLSKRCRFTYGGYAFAQLKRIRTHRGYLLKPVLNRPERADFGLKEKRAVTTDEVNNFLWLVAKLLEDSIEMLKISDKFKSQLADTNFIGLVQSKSLDMDACQTLHQLTGAPDGFIDSCMREKQYLHAVRDWEAYNRWKETRNKKRQELEAKHGYDCKHAMHLVRLLRMGMEVLQTKKLQVAREDAQELLEIRNGSWPFEKVEQYAIDCNDKLAELVTITDLPNAPDVNAIEEICIRIIEEEMHD